MSLVKTLAKVALGVAAAKVAGRAAQPAPMKGPNSQPGQVDPLSSILGSKGQAGGGLGSLLEQLAPGAGAGGARPGPSATASAPSGGLDALIRGLAGAASGGTTKETISKTSTEGSFADVLNQSFQKYGEPNISPTPQQDAAAGLMLRAMLQAAKCDGRIDDGEKKKNS